MCEKPFDSFVCNVAFFLTSSAGLVAGSGIALRLGGILMSKLEPENTEYPFYAAESGFFIGVQSAAYFQWMTAGLVALFIKVNASNFEKKLCNNLVSMYFQNFLLLTLFGGLHYFSLPMSVKGEAGCSNLKEQISGSQGSGNTNPLCDADHSWASLFTAFSVGSSIFFVGFLLLQTIYLCMRAACQTEIAPSTEPAVEAPVIIAGPVSTKMMSGPAPNVDLQLRPPL